MPCRYHNVAVLSIARPESRRVTFSVVKHYDRESRLLPSGLLGPVTLQSRRELPFALPRSKN